MPRTARLPRRAFVAAGVAAAALSLSACGAAPVHGPGRAADRVAPPARDGRLVLVSGRDDHGELAEPAVALSATVQGSRTVAAVPDGTLARVVASDGQWQEVQSLDGTPARGWVDDFHLRGVVHLVGPAPTCSPRFDAGHLAPGTQAVVLGVGAGGALRVRTLGTRALTGLVPRADVRELPPAGPGCGDGTDPRTDHHGSHHH
ncbi:hypothetical protein [Oryzihumus sp.]|uniref:hypothetical protein n=1 Tax=Oryzihumus sp. TaxID=1968903 RepID=UPI002EDAF3F7